jgi:hypothetical protein
MCDRPASAPGVRVPENIRHSARLAFKAHRPIVDIRRVQLLRPLRVPAFRRLAVSYTCNELSTTFAGIALAVLVFARTHSAAATTGLFVAAAFLPALGAPALTARLDRIAVRRALPALYLVEAALLAVLVAGAGRLWLPVVLAIAFVDGVVAMAARALSRAAVAATLGPDDLLETGNKLLNVAFSVSFAAGPAVAAGVVAVAGTSGALAVASGLFLAMAIVLATARTLPAARADAGVPWPRRLREGIAHARGNTTVRRVLEAHAGAMCFAAIVVPIEVVYARDALHGGPEAYGLLLAAWGAGTVLSSVALAAVKRPAGLLRIPASAAAIGCAYLVMAAAPSLTVALAGCVVGGAGNGVYFVSVMQALQDRVGQDFQARIVSLLDATNSASYGVGFLVGGAVATLAGARAAIALAGAGVLVAAAAITALLSGRRRAPAGARAADRAADHAALAPDPARP